jgi:hypothetical protein
MIYDSSYTNWDREVNPNPVGQGAFPTDQYIFGDKLFQALNRLPTGTPITCAVQSNGQGWRRSLDCRWPQPRL